MKVAKFAVADAPFERAPGRAGDVLLGDVVDEQDGGPITVGFGRYAPRRTLADTVVADEAMLVAGGRPTVRGDDVAVAADPGEVVDLPRGAAVAITAHGEGAEIVSATYPHWKTASPRGAGTCRRTSSARTGSGGYYPPPNNSCAHSRSPRRLTPLFGPC